MTKDDRKVADWAKNSRDYLQSSCLIQQQSHIRQSKLFKTTQSVKPKYLKHPRFTARDKASLSFFG